MKSGITLFKERLAREGRLEAFEAKKRELTAEHEGDGTHHLKIEQLAAKALGYESPAAELALCGENPKAALSWDAIMARLPAKADDTTETQWIAAHPAMSRQLRAGDKDSPVVVTTKDIADAPSRTAVNDLLGWMERPTKFLEMRFQEARKRLDEKGSEEESVDVSLGEVERLLKEFRSE